MCSVQEGYNMDTYRRSISFKLILMKYGVGSVHMNLTL
jgi:hypothetical protein